MSFLIKRITSNRNVFPRTPERRRKKKTFRQRAHAFSCSLQLLRYINSNKKQVYVTLTGATYLFSIIADNGKTVIPRKPRNHVGRRKVAHQWVRAFLLPDSLICITYNKIDLSHMKNCALGLLYSKRITGIEYIRKLRKVLFNACQMVRTWSPGDSLLMMIGFILVIMGDVW